ncbi:dihydroorotate dehydrogenase-like protein [Candidatus Sumerlaeota bacterium]|nr:dihydroorotate dehydrogenase-like protein [Candidatus Sumerlaeota bacterium]
MIDQTTQYLGMKLKNPLVASASPLSEKLENIRKMEDAGFSAVVMHSLFEEQIEIESHDLNMAMTEGAESFAESLDYFPQLGEYKVGPDSYLELIRQATEAVDIPVIGSINGATPGGWVKFAKMIEQAGADAVELNIYHIATNPKQTAQEVEQIYVDLVGEVKKNISIPLAVKIGPYFSAMANMAGKLDKAGADALVLFNRFYQPDLDLESLEVVPDLILSSPHRLRVRLRWVAILYGQLQCNMALTGGVHSSEDVLKAIMAGADVTMMTSAILKNGIGHIENVRSGLLRWMEEKEYESFNQMRGSMSQKAVANPQAFERANYLKVLSSYKPVV